MGDFFLKIFFTPSCVCSKWSARHGDQFGVCMLGYTRTPPPWGPRRLTGRPTSPPPLQTPKGFRTRLGVKIRTGRLPWGNDHFSDCPIDAPIPKMPLSFFFLVLVFLSAQNGLVEEPKRGGDGG